MKKISIALCMTLLCGLLVPISVMGQHTPTATSTLSLTVSGSALLDIVTGKTINLSLGGAIIAGAPVAEVAEDHSGRLRISSLVDGAGTRTIMASGGTDFSATNTQLKVKFLPPTSLDDFANYAVNGGTLADTVLLSTAPKPVVTLITNCWSGYLNDDDGYVIQYFFEKIPLKTTFSSPHNITVTYTLSDPA